MMASALTLVNAFRDKITPEHYACNSAVSLSETLENYYVFQPESEEVEKHNPGNCIMCGRCSVLPGERNNPSKWNYLEDSDCFECVECFSVIENEPGFDHDVHDLTIAIS